MKNSVRKGIRIANENEGSPIEKPEEIIVFDNLQRAGSTPTIVKDIIKYEARELTKKKGIEIVGNKVCWIIHGCYISMKAVVDIIMIEIVLK